MSEKHFLMKITTSFTTIVLCLVGLVVTTFAMFTSQIEPVNKQFTSSNFSIEAEIHKDDEDGEIVKPDSNGVLAEGNYYIILSAKGSAEKTSGFGKITIADDLVKYTPQMRTEQQKTNNVLPGKPTEIIMTLELTTDTTFEITSSWATYSGNFQNTLNETGKNKIKY